MGGFHQVYKVVLDETEYASAVITEADKGTVAILSTLDKLDRQVEEVSNEITAYVTFVHRSLLGPKKRNLPSMTV